MQNTHAHEKLQDAVAELVSERPIRDRLEHALRLHCHRLREDELPEDLRPQFRKLWARVTEVGEPRHRIAATLDKMSSKEMEAIAKEIEALAGAVALVLVKPTV